MQDLVDSIRIVLNCMTPRWFWKIGRCEKKTPHTFGDQKHWKGKQSEFGCFCFFFKTGRNVIHQKKTEVLFPEKSKWMLNGKTKNYLLKSPPALSLIFSFTITSYLLRKSRKILFTIRLLFASTMPERIQFYLKHKLCAHCPPHVIVSGKGKDEVLH